MGRTFVHFQPKKKNYNAVTTGKRVALTPVGDKDHFNHPATYPKST